MTAYTFRTLPIELRNTSAWRQVDLSQMSEEDKSRFLRLKAGIEDYIATGKLKEAAKSAACNTSNLLRHLNRCVASDENGQLFGWLGLVKHFRVKAAELPPGEDIVDQYLSHFATQARKDAKKRPKAISKAATKVARVIHETGKVPPASDYVPPSKTLDDRPVRSLTGIVKTPSWKTVT